jgi:hypothetical protein
MTKKRTTLAATGSALVLLAGSGVAFAAGQTGSHPAGLRLATLAPTATAPPAGSQHRHCTNMSSAPPSGA